MLSFATALKTRELAKGRVFHAGFRIGQERRQTPARQEILHFADLALYPSSREALRGDRRLELTAKEFDLLELFIRNPRQVLTRDLIYDRIWNYDFGGESNIIEVYIRYLRSKLEADGESRLLYTVRGVGYVLRED